MSLLLLLSAVLAHGAEPVDELVWARPFTLKTPESFDQRTSFEEGWIVELRADPTLLRPSQLAAPVPYAGTTPMMQLNWDYQGGCLVALVPAAVDLAATELYFGSPELPERVDADRAAQELEAARKDGIRPPPAEQVAKATAAGGAPLAAEDLREVHAIAMERVAACTSTPSDRKRSGIPAAE